MNSMAANEALLLLTGSLCLHLLIVVIKILHKYWWTPLRIQHEMNLQGINGPPYKFIHGNTKEDMKMKQEALSKPMATLSHDILPRAQPQVQARLNLYGKNYLSWAGNGLVAAEGEKLAKQRKLANSAFHGESLKSMTWAMIASVEMMLERWKHFEGKEIEVFEEFKLLTSEVISRTAFGSSYLEGQKIFDMLTRLSVLTYRNQFNVKFPIISKFWKTAYSIEAGKLAKGIHNSVMEIVKKREEKVFSGEVNSFGTDFLGLLLSTFHDPDKKNRLPEQDLVDECKTFYFAGHETTNSALAWTVLLLAIHHEWQEKARKEVIEVFGNQNPHSQGIGRLN
ncbi:Cytochrome P450 [Corchorus olitorius]|uniref:Cytochrome P450 n=1 Tax=Corchorus olitorius TaxID=93759 RepID=A0A1R3HD51_9ROSI|nr:Cytochrome P450 [Corchorus olitorius]